MVVLNFTCTEKKQALIDKSVSQTIRTDVGKFFPKSFLKQFKETELMFYSDNLDRAMVPFYPLHIWWNARNFHVEDVCECGAEIQEHDDKWFCPNKKGNGFSYTDTYRRKRFGLGKSQFLGMGEITSIVKKKVSEITKEDAFADGFPTRDTCVNWILRHNKNLTLDSYVYVIRWRWME